MDYSKSKTLQKEKYVSRKLKEIKLSALELFRKLNRALRYSEQDKALDKLKVSVVGAVGVVIIPELLKILLAPYVIGWFLG